MNEAEFKAFSQQWREGLGFFGTEQELERAVLTRPMDALGKVLGVRLGRSPHDDMIIANRRAAYGITGGDR